MAMTQEEIEKWWEDYFKQIDIKKQLEELAEYLWLNSIFPWAFPTPFDHDPEK